MKRSLLLLSALLCASAIFGVSQTKPAAVDLATGFEHPPQSARPLVWWHWMNGNITEQGIRLDLDWMHRIGLGGIPGF